MNTSPGSVQAASERRFLVLGLLPLVLIVALMMIGPVLNLGYMAVHELHWRDGTLHTEFVGLRHVKAFADNQLYWAGLRNTTVFASATVVLQILFGLMLALAVRKMQRGRALLFTIILIPIVVPPIVIGAMWKLILNTEIGVVNAILTGLGFDRVDWLGSASTALATVVAVDVWHWTPFTFLLLLAGLESLPSEVYESSRMDTLSEWQELRYVTLPMLWPTIAITAMFRLILSFKVFDEIYLLTSGGPGTSTEVVSYSIYRTFFTEDRTGLGATMSLFTCFVLALAAIVMINLRKRSSP